MTRVYLSGDPTHDRVLEAFYEGIEGEKELVRNWDYKPSKVAVVFGVYKSKVPASFPRGEIFQRQRSKNLDVIVLETGYINRGDGENHHYAAGFNGLNGRADFRNTDMPDDRAIKLRKSGHLRVLNWLDGGENILLCGQVPWDASVENSDHLLWLQATVERLKAYSRRPIVFRPHPKSGVGLRLISGVQVSFGRPIEYDLEKAHCVVTYNSNAGVDALLRGVPVFAHDIGSMCWAVANKSLLSVDVPNRPDRTQWLNDLCYTQWTLDEMRSGEAWRHLSR
jgi:hypothetical protein